VEAPLNHRVHSPSSGWALRGSPAPKQSPRSPSVTVRWWKGLACQYHSIHFVELCGNIGNKTLNAITNWKEQNMSDYNRTTRECPVSQLHPELLQAIQSYFQEHKLGDLEAETLMCCETISTKKNFGRLVSLLKGVGDKTIHTGMLLTSQWLIWVRRGDQSGTLLNAANLKEIQVRTYISILTKDTGLEIFGYIRDSKGQVRGYVGMGAELAAQKFYEEVKKAITNVNPPTPKSLPKWMGG
jgi:hypothetical protein